MKTGDKPFGVMLRAARVAAEMTQEDLAARSGLSVRAISDLERDRTRAPHFRSARLLAEALAVPEPMRNQLLEAARLTRQPATTARDPCEPSLGAVPNGPVIPLLTRPGHPWKRVVVGLILILSVAGGAFTGVALTAQPTPAHSAFLGPVDLEKYCQATGFTGVSLDGKTAYDWHCVQPLSGRSSLSVIEACQWQYKSSTATARYAEMSDPYSWQCWDHVIVLGRVDLQKYCAALGFTRPVLEGATADDWYCAGGHRGQMAIDPDSSCRWQYGQRVLVATEPHYHQPWEHWDCWG